MIKSRKAILGRGGEISATAGLKDLPKAIYNIPADASLSFVTDEEVAYEKTVPANACPYAQLNKVGGMTYKCNNLIPYPYADTNKTENGITWTVNADGSVTANGTATANTYFYFEKRNTSVIAPFDMTLSGCPSGGGYSTYELQVWLPGSQVSDLGESNLVPKGFEYSSIYAVVRPGCTVENVTFKPMLNAGTTALPYEPYFDGLRNAAVEEVKSEGANLIPFPYYDERTNINGVSVVYNSDGSINLNGKPTITSFVYLRHKSNPFFIKAGTYTISGGISNNLYLRLYNIEDSKDAMTSMGESVTHTFNKDCWVAANYVMASVTETFKNLTLYPMLNRKSEALPFTPYVGTLDTFKIPEAVQSIDGYGEGINGRACNYAEFVNKQFVNMLGKIYAPSVISVGKHENGQQYAIVRAQKPKANGAVLSTNYDSASWSDNDKRLYSIGGSIIINDSRFLSIDDAQRILTQENTIIYYERETPEITDISELLPPDNFIKVEGNGTLIFENENKYDVPSSVKYVTKVG
ncbi:MAG: hypothetical protein J6J71_04525 [Prevotella sp.]|nr:hypothetical protein [Prevotella sp.]